MIIDALKKAIENDGRSVGQISMIVLGDQGALSKMIKGKRKPNIDTIEKVLAYLGYELTVDGLKKSEKLSNVVTVNFDNGEIIGNNIVGNNITGNNVVGNNNSVNITNTKKTVQRNIISKDDSELTASQLSKISNLVKAIFELSKWNGKNLAMQNIWSRIYRKYRITSYYHLPAEEYDDCIAYLRKLKGMAKSGKL